METSTIEIALLVGVFAVVAIFLTLRRFCWWYFGINRMVDALESIDASLKCLPAVQARTRAAAAKRSREVARTSTAAPDPMGSGAYNPRVRGDA